MVPVFRACLHSSLDQWAANARCSPLTPVFHQNEKSRRSERESISCRNTTVKVPRQADLTGTVVQKMESEQLERLRHANQDLLERLKAKQEEIKKALPRKLLSATSLSKRTTFAERSVPLPKRGKENHVHATKGAADPAGLTSVEPGASTARAALRSPLKPTACSRERRGMLHLRAGPELGSPKAERSFTPVAATARETSRMARSSNGLRRPEEESILVKHRESRKQSTFLHSPQQRGKPRAEAKSVPGRTPTEGNSRRRAAIRDPQTPKSILLTPQGKEPKEASRVTFLSDPEEYTIPATSWSVRPFLGYDWIAGLLDTDSSLSEKSEQYFSELREFRQVNKEACVHEQDLGLEASDSLAPSQEADCISSSHQCVYCYRLNRRLFTIPVDSGSACPVCKTPRARRPPETLEEPAYVRVSIPRSTLLPAYKFRIHRRKSFEPTDNLALPSHCLAGWENVVPSTSPTLSSLDLRTSLEQKPTDPSHPTLASRISGGTRTDQLLNLSRSAHFRLSHAQQRARDQSLYYRATLN
ncbi:migration and invasion-inhibitory protein isoform X3 [Pelodiscus sinensis]|uniref:migration and invasion-inhibitory protein isoform X3 n=1 Tax=Pelodiscus sinensis TaxID=13735 RepID=UPI003F6CD296